jgi:hypothetical protein
VKVVPRSVMILFGTPKRCVMSPMNFATSSDVTSATGHTSIHLVNLSTATSSRLGQFGTVPRSRGPTWRRAMMEELCAGPELASAVVWKIIGILCTCLRGL